jgi:hypothetical protein
VHSDIRRHGSRALRAAARRHRGGQCRDLGLADHRDGLEVEGVEGFVGGQPGFGEMAFESASAALGNLMVGRGQ